MKRGTIKAFREYLNAKCGMTHHHNRYHQVSRKYGDYLYYQDRDKFMWELNETLNGIANQDFKY